MFPMKVPASKVRLVALRFSLRWNLKGEPLSKLPLFDGGSERLLRTGQRTRVEQGVDQRKVLIPHQRIIARCRC